MLKITRFSGELLLFNREVVSNSFETPWTASLSMEFPRPEYWSGLPFPSPGYFPDPGIRPASPALQADSSLLNCWGNPFLERPNCVSGSSLTKALTFLNPVLALSYWTKSSIPCYRQV